VVIPRNHQHVKPGLGVDVAEGHAELVLGHDVGGNLAGNDPAEDAVG
jgi:hypothetical protein